MHPAFKQFRNCPPSHVEDALDKNEQREIEAKRKRQLRKAMAKREAKPIAQQQINRAPNVQVKKS